MPEKCSRSRGSSLGKHRKTGVRMKSWKKIYWKIISWLILFKTYTDCWLNSKTLSFPTLPLMQRHGLKIKKCIFLYLHKFGVSKINLGMEPQAFAHAQLQITYFLMFRLMPLPYTGTGTNLKIFHTKFTYLRQLNLLFRPLSRFYVTFSVVFPKLLPS